MNKIHLSKISHATTLLIVITLLFLLGGCAQQVPRSITLDNGENAILTKGIVKNVSLANNTVLFKQLKGPKINLRISDAVFYRGISSAQEIKEGMSLEIIYQAKNNKNTVIQVKKLPNLGCGDV